MAEVCECSKFCALGYRVIRRRCSHVMARPVCRVSSIADLFNDATNVFGVVTVVLRAILSPHKPDHPLPGATEDTDQTAADHHMRAEKEYGRGPKINDR